MVLPVFLTVWLAPAGITISSPGPAERLPLEANLDLALDEHHDLIDVMDEVRPDLTRRVRPYIAAEP